MRVGPEPDSAKSGKTRFEHRHVNPARCSLFLVLVMKRHLLFPPRLSSLSTHQLQMEFEPSAALRGGGGGARDKGAGEAGCVQASHQMEKPSQQLAIFTGRCCVFHDGGLPSRGHPRQLLLLDVHGDVHGGYSGRREAFGLVGHRHVYSRLCPFPNFPRRG